MNKQGYEYLAREVNQIEIDQRINDGYVNATALCKASGKLIADYLRLDSTKEFLTELESDVGNPISELVQVVKGGNPQLQGTWVHPYVAIT
ncbi:MAG: KilA-N domain-containing protein, partial [Xanthomonadaceae bacterium]|nr:KilA-N domain-containing protein [Xanthomonadaceae bacterium]